MTILRIIELSTGHVLVSMGPDPCIPRVGEQVVANVGAEVSVVQKVVWRYTEREAIVDVFVK